MIIVKQICPKKKKKFGQVGPALRTNVTCKIEKVSTDIRRQMRVKGEEFDSLY